MRSSSLQPSFNLSIDDANKISAAVLAQPLSELPYLTVIQQRILCRIQVNSRGCWVWQGALASGYGRMGAGMENEAKIEGVHRLAYREWRGDVPARMQLDHEKCDNPPCCNPWHLEPKTSWKNLQRSKTNPFAVKARAGSCIRGHEFTPENTYIHPQRGTRHCKQCGREANARIQAARPAEKAVHPGPRRTAS